MIDMKKKYMPPSVMIVHLNSQRHLLFSSSDVTSDGDYVTGLTFGGVFDGSITPEVKSHNIWDDDWSE